WLARVGSPAAAGGTFLHRYRGDPDSRSFPTRRSSDLTVERGGMRDGKAELEAHLRSGRFLAGAAKGRWRLVEFRWPIALIEVLRSEEHTSELQSRFDLVCRLLLEKKNRPRHSTPPPPR